MATYICTKCGWEGERKRLVRGSKTVEMLIWSILVVPGPFYSVWRRTGKSNDCPNCGLPMLVKLESDAGWLVKRKFDIELGLITPEPKKEAAATPAVFGNDKPAEPAARKKPVNPDEW